MPATVMISRAIVRSVPSVTFVQVTRPDGSPLHLMTSPYPVVLVEHVTRGEWEKAMLLCR